MGIASAGDVPLTINQGVVLFALRVALELKVSAMVTGNGMSFGHGFGLSVRDLGVALRCRRT